MLVFQLVAIPLALLLFLWSAVRLFLGDRPRWIALARPLLWLAAAVAVWRPDLTTKVAQLLGIGRGADLVLYALALAFLAAVFYFYRKSRQLEGEITRLVRHVALTTAESGAEQAQSDEGQTTGARE
ncbi:MAG: DUF2304 domain-containing protein [Acidobacteriota bacterium]|nr:DUF2304 domain-containing protein [Acidobacteriota bacterium]MDH3523628.1 DUF2304 domain-containing protein [Acidobacteriota bacterium]